MIGQRAARGLWDMITDPRPVADRATLLPIGQYDDGSLTLAWPQFLVDAAEGAQRSYLDAAGISAPDTAGGKWSSNVDALNAASVGPMGGVVGRMAGAIPRGALGSGGSDMRPGSLPKLRRNPDFEPAPLVEEVYQGPPAPGPRVQHLPPVGLDQTAVNMGPAPPLRRRPTDGVSANAEPAAIPSLLSQEEPDLPPLLANLESYDLPAIFQQPVTGPRKADPFDSLNDPFLEVPQILNNPFGVPPPPPLPESPRPRPRRQFIPRG